MQILFCLIIVDINVNDIFQRINQQMFLYAPLVSLRVLMYELILNTVVFNRDTVLFAVQIFRFHKRQM